MLLKNLLAILGALLFIYSIPGTGVKQDFVSSIQKTEVKKTCSSNPNNKRCSKQCLPYPATTNNHKSDFPTECSSPIFFLGEISEINYFTPLTLESLSPRSISNLHNSLFQETDPKPPRFIFI
jgi:hypothetical protein